MLIKILKTLIPVKLNCAKGNAKIVYKGFAQWLKKFSGCGAANFAY
jgi:hypothetical protein